MSSTVHNLDALVELVIAEGASDLHIAEGRKPLVRVSGYLVPMLKEEVIDKARVEAMIREVLSEGNYRKFIEDKEIDFSYTHKSGARFRGNAYFQQGSVALALRFIPRHIRTIEELNLPPILHELAQRQQGFFLVVGPVGSGKTTTLAAIISAINTSRAEHIVTIENPIEYIHEQGRSLIDQREVRVDTKGFDAGLRAVFRQDVDVVMIGEMRSFETISTAVTAAETGHLVLSTLHTNNAAQTIDRIIDSFPSEQQAQIRSQLAGSLTAIFSQRLLPRISGGLIPAYELLLNTTAVANLIREGRVHEIPTVIETGSEHGMIDMNRSLAELVRAGEVSLDHARAYSPNPQLLDRFV